MKAVARRVDVDPGERRDAVGGEPGRVHDRGGAHLRAPARGVVRDGAPAVRAALERGELAAQRDLHAVRLALGGEGERQRVRVDDAAPRREEARDGRDVRLARAHGRGVEPAQPRYAVALGLGLERIEPRHLLRGGRDHELAERAVRDAALGAARVQPPRVPRCSRAP